MPPKTGYVAKDRIEHVELWSPTKEEKAFLLKRCAMVGAERARMYMVNTWIENDEDGFTGWRWIKYNRELRLVCAANRYKDLIFTGVRHSCPIMTTSQAMFGGLDVLHEYANGDNEQGFIDQYGTFYNRSEALALAKSNGQLLYPDNVTLTELFSEGLY